MWDMGCNSTKKAFAVLVFFVCVSLCCFSYFDIVSVFYSYFSFFPTWRSGIDLLAILSVPFSVFHITKSSNRIDMLPANVPKSGFYFYHCWFNKNGFFFYFLSPAGRLAGRCQLQKVDFFISKDVKNIILPSNNTSITTSQLKKSALRMQGYICYENSFDFDGFFPKQQRRCEELPVATKI